MLLLALSTGQKVGLGLAVAAFAGFALIASMLVPRYRPQFPGRGLTVFLIATVLMFLGMISAVEFLGRESSEAQAEGAAETGASESQTTATSQSATTATTATTQKAASSDVDVSEVEYKIKLPKTSLAAGSYTFVVKNDGKFPHDLVVKGNGVNEKTPTIDAGKSASLKVDLKAGTYDVYCSIPGHKQLGMDVKLTITA